MAPTVAAKQECSQSDAGASGSLIWVDQGTRMMVLLRKFWNDTVGATAIEYGLIAALISVALISGVGLFGSNLSNMFNMISGRLNNQ